MAISLRMQRALERAAEMKAAGSSWEVIANALHRKVQTVKKWPQVYVYEWQELFGKLEKQFLEEAAAESVLALRKQLRIETSTVSIQAADKLIRYRISRVKSAPPPTATANVGPSVEERDRLFAKEWEEEVQRAKRAASAEAASNFQRDPTHVEAT